jgi:hypothetical protein
MRMSEPDRTAVAPPPPGLGGPRADEAARWKAERDEAVAACRRLEHELGALRGQVKRLELMMYRRTMRRQRWLGRMRRVAGWLPSRRP